MHRFIAMIWDENDLTRLSRVNLWAESLQQKSARWMPVLEAPGLRVLAHCHQRRGSTVATMDDEIGIVVGPLFRRGEERAGRVQRLGREEAERIVSGGGDWLIKEYWGGYVAFWRDPQSRRTQVLRDPSGALSCFMSLQHGVEVLFANAEDVADLPSVSFSIDWDYLKSFLLSQSFVTPHCGLKEIKEVLAGQRVDFHVRATHRFSWLWHGVEIAAAPNMQSFEDAKAELRTTAEACFAGWGKEYNSILVRLSEGLDSSIVANLLRRSSDAAITAQHFVGVGYEEYEANLARLSAAHGSIALVELPTPRSSDLRAMIDGPRIARPGLFMLGIEAHQALIQLCNQLDVDAVMGGLGGDQLFMRRGSGIQTLTDYWLLNRYGPDFWRVAYETAMLAQRSVWDVVQDTTSVVMGRRPWRPHGALDQELFLKDRLLRDDLVSNLPHSYLSHPWLSGAASLPRGVADQLHGIITLQDYFARYGYGLEHHAVEPLISQPIIEFVLRTPTYVLAHGGLDRALERRAFSDLVPDAVFRRTGKGGIGHTALHHMRDNLDFFRDLVLSGTFVAHGWVDRAKTERMLQPGFVTNGENVLFLYALVVAEAWIRCWGRSSARAVA